MLLNGQWVRQGESPITVTMHCITAIVQKHVVYNPLVSSNSDDIIDGHHGDDLCGHTFTWWWPSTCSRSTNLEEVPGYHCDSMLKVGGHVTVM